MIPSSQDRHTSGSVFANLAEILLGRVSIAQLVATIDERAYFDLGDLGHGLFAKRLIKSGELILMFTGPIIGFTQAVAKGERECWPLQVGRDQYIDLEKPGCYANHSCDPNSGVVLDRFLLAIRDIPEGTEIRYDYSTTVDEDHWSMECRCKSRQCRGIIADFKCISPALRNMYISLGIVQSFIVSQFSSSKIAGGTAPEGGGAVLRASAHPVQQKTSLPKTRSD